MKKPIKTTFGLRDIKRVSDLKQVVGGAPIKTRSGHALEFENTGTTSGGTTTTGTKT